MKVKKKYKLLSVLTAVIMAVSMLPLSSFAEEDESADVHHYFAFASDLHADPGNLFEDAYSTLTTSMKGFPGEIDYVSLLGDAVGDGTGAPAYKISELYGAFTESLKTEDWHLLSKDFSVVPSENDLNAEIDSMVGFLNKTESEEFYHGITHDGITYGYCYGIGVDGMGKGGEDSMNAAMIFKHWVKNKDTTIPIVVLSHLPIEALCGDNPGASYWNEALNFAATGVEGITGDDDSHAIIRNVIFLSGHNHIKDETEYVYRAGSKMTIQADTTLEGSENAQNTESTIYYTSLAPGYLCASGNATLMDIAEDTITFTKYNNGSEVSLGKDGVTGETLGSSLTLKKFKKSDEGGPAIAKQPENAVVSYPDGATFTVEAENLEEIASYQWFMLDIEDQLICLQGSSAHTNTLVIPSTMRRDNTLRFYCQLTGKDGLKTVTRQAALEKDNAEAVKPVFYVGEYAVEPGESIDLSEVDIGDGYKLGSGRVTFDSNATDIRIDNLDFDNSHTRCDLAIGPNVGLDLEDEDPETDTYNIIFTGENRIMNTFFDKDYNLGGIPFDICITGDGQKPLVNFIGDGTLSITNGYNAIRVIGDLMIGIDITVDQRGMNYADGIAAHNILVSEGRKLDLTVNGFAFNAARNLFMKDAEVNILANTPHISQGTVTKSTVGAGGAISIENTKLDIRAISDQDLCTSTSGNVLLNANGELFITRGSEVNCDIQFKGQDVFAYGFTGIRTLNGDIEDSTVSVKLDSENCFNSMGLYAEEDYLFLNSKLKVDMRSDGVVYGAAAERDFSADDSLVDINAVSTSSDENEESYGLFCENAVFKATDKKNTMKFAADGGKAVVCAADMDYSDTPIGYEEGYKSKNFYLRDDTVCLTPSDNVISLTSIPVIFALEQKYAALETVYDVKDTSKPAEVVVFGLEDSGTENPFEDVIEGRYYYDAVAWAVNHDPQITNGTDETHFSPDKKASRANVVTFLWRAAGCPEPKSTENPFSDVEAGKYYYDAVMWAVENGITNGKTGTTFGPDDDCTRGQVVTFLWRAAGKPEPSGKDDPFTDVKADAFYYYAVLWAFSHTPQITNGMTENTFGTEESCTRGQIVTFLYRAE